MMSVCVRSVQILICKQGPSSQACGEVDLFNQNFQSYRYLLDPVGHIQTLSGWGLGLGL